MQFLLGESSLLRDVESVRGRITKCRRFEKLDSPKAGTLFSLQDLQLFPRSWVAVEELKLGCHSGWIYRLVWFHTIVGIYSS